MASNGPASTNDSISTDADKSLSGGLTPDNYDDKLKATICDWLEQEMSVKTGEKLAENIADSKQRRRLGYLAVGLATSLMIFIIIMLWHQIMSPNSAFSTGEEIWPKLVYISASLLSCVAICAVFINGVFRKSAGESQSTSLRDVIGIVRGLNSNQ